MSRKLYPTQRLDPFHELIHSLKDIDLRLRRLENLFSKREKDILSKVPRLRKFYYLVKEGEILVKREQTIVNDCTFGEFKFTNKNNPMGHIANNKELEYLKNIFLKSNEAEEIREEKNEIFSLYLIKVVSQFEYYIMRIFYIVFYDYKTLFSNEKEYQEIKKYDFYEQIKWLKSKNLGFTYINSRTIRAIEYIATRNALIHNNGIINFRYLNIVKNSVRKNGEKIILDFKYVKFSIGFFIILAQSIDDVIAKKILNIAYLPKSIEDDKNNKAFMKFLRKKPKDLFDK